MSIPSKFWSPMQIADLLATHVKNVRAWIKLGQLRAISLGTGKVGARWARVRVSGDELERFLDSRRTVAEVQGPRTRRKPKTEEGFYGPDGVPRWQSIGLGERIEKARKPRQQCDK